MTAIPRILVHSPRQDEAQRYADLIRLHSPDADIVVSTTAEDAERLIDDAEILMGWHFPPPIFKKAARLRWIHKVSAGVDDVPMDTAISAHVVLTRSNGALIAPRMIEYVVGAIFAIVQHFRQAWRQQLDRRWEAFPVGLAHGSTVGVAGLGDIGEAIAHALQRNGMRVIGWRRTQTASSGVERVYAGLAELEAFATACDFLVIVLPATASTRGIFSGEVFGAMKPSSWLINLGRGSVVDEPALIAALRGGTLAGAVLDVFAEEPLPATSPLWGLDNVLITPHVAGPIVPEDVVGCFLENFIHYRRGEPMRRQVDRARGY